jgi:hypothetical protein
MLTTILLGALVFGTGLISQVSADSAVNVLDPVCSKYANESNPDRIPAACKDNNAVVGNNRSDPNDDNNPIFGPQGIITGFIKLLSVITGITAVIAILAAGLRFITSGNNPKEVNVAREMIIYASIGLVIAASAQAIVRFWLYKI